MDTQDAEGLLTGAAALVAAVTALVAQLRGPGGGPAAARAATERAARRSDARLRRALRACAAEHAENARLRDALVGYHLPEQRPATGTVTDPAPPHQLRR